MNENDYDNDGNNIVPCPICLDRFCPSKEEGKCPREEEFATHYKNADEKRNMIFIMQEGVEDKSGETLPLGDLSRFKK